MTRPISQWLNDNSVALDQELVQFIHAFFNIVVPKVEPICCNCFKVSMADMGFGIKYLNQLSPGLSYEVRLSPTKMGGMIQQSEMYITNRVVFHVTPRYIQWIQSPSLQPIDKKYALTQNPGDSINHIPYLNCDQKEIFDFLKSQTSYNHFRALAPNMPNLVIPLCQCQPTI